MPEGSDGIVRAEFQGDSDFNNNSVKYCIMIDQFEVSRHSDDYNSSGGSDSENDSKVWDRSPRNGHPRERFHGRADLHGSQKGIRSGKRIQPSRSGSQTTSIGQKKKQATSLPAKCKITKPRRRFQSCSDEELKLEKKQSDVVTRYLKRVKENGDEAALEIQTAKSEVERENSVEKSKWVIGSKELIRKENENLPGFEMYADNNQKGVEYAAEPSDVTDNASYGIFKDNKEIYEKEVEKSEKFDEEKAYIYEKEKKFTETVAVDTMMEKDEKDSFNVQQSLKTRLSKKFEKDQTDMLEKQKMKKGDGQTSEKRDKEKEITAEQSKNVPSETLEMKIEHLKVEQYERAREKLKQKRAGIDEIFDADRHSQKEKLIVNLEQGKLGQKYGATVYQLDNKILDSMEREDKEEREQTVLKEVLDPQGENEMEKQDTIKEESLGLEVEGKCAEFEEPESTLQIAEKIWEKRQRELERFTSVDENSFNFPSEYPSTDLESSSLCTSYKCLLESDDLSDVDRSCPDFHRLNIVQDSNRITDHSENMFAYLNVFDTEALWERNKNRIIETIDTRSGKEEYLESNEEKFRKEVIDKSERTEDECHVDNGENADIISPVETDDDDNDDVNHVEIENTDPTENSMEVTDAVDCVGKAIEEREADDIDQDNDKMNRSDDKPLKIIDAEEKDEDEKEKVEVLELVTNYKEEKGEQAKMPDAPVFEKDSDILETGDTPNMPHMQVFVRKGISGGRDIETRNTKHRTECTKTKRNKKGSKSNKKYGRKKLQNKTPDIWMKMKKSPKVTLPKQKETDRLAPKRNWNGRRHSMFVCREFGRKCSTNSGGKGGSFEGDPNSSNSQRNNEDKNSKNRRNQNNKDRDSEDKNNNNNNSRQNNPGVNTATEPEITVHAEPTRRIIDVNTPVDDFKRYKKKGTDTDEKKHTNLEDFGWLYKTTSVIDENKGPTVTLFDRLTEEERRCVLERLDKPQELPEDALHCSICLTVDSLLKHYAHCMSVFNNCDMCVKIFSLICSHVVACINNNSVIVCDIRICKTIKLVAENNIVVHMKTLWFQVRKKLARILDDTEEDVVQQQTPAEEPKPRRTSKVLSSFSGPLPSIPEGTPLSITSTSRSSSRVLHRKKSNLANVEEQEQREVSEEGSSWGAAEVEAAGAQGVGEVDDADDSYEAVDSKYGLDQAQAKVIYSRPEIPVPDEADAIPTSSEDGSVESTGSGSTEGSGQFGLMAGASRFRSLPMGPPGQGEPYYPSFKDRPTGKKGIGEVVYASKHQLVVVVTIWEKFKTQYLIEAKLAKHYTEEGVILPEFKSKLRIKGLRYQNEFQWIKVAHLGNGMTGKCHLATDFETDFKFCVKEIHISNYEKEEIELWSELEHPYIVQVYGAIRHGEKIYILQEFIEGGCLTEAINVQRKLSRRLSQLTALRYFQQLLQVLKYLKSRNILHEDLKADNILLNKTGDTVTIKVADFGLARRCQGFVRGGTKPVGTQTQWSPEKAEARVGYGFAAEVWAGICVLVHMLSGQPPWVRRYESFKALIVVIVEKSPPMEDIPRNIHESIKDLIKRGFTVCQGQRPTTEQLLEHCAFRLLDEATAMQSMNGTYSILESLHFESHTNQIDYDPNADLREIYRNLERESGQGAAGGNGTRRKDKKGSVVNVHSEEVPYFSNEYRVYNSGLGEGYGKKDENSQLSLEQTTRYNSKSAGDTEHNKNKPGSSNSVDIYTRNRLPSNPDNNVDPTTHIDRFFNDIAGPTVPPQVQPNLVVYHPSLESIGSQKGNSGSQHSSLEHLSSGTVTNRLIPDFGKIGMLSDPGEEFPNNDNIADEVFDEASDDEKNEEFNFERGLEYVEGQYTLPTVLNTSADLSPGLLLTPAQSSSSLISTERSTGVGEVDNQQEGSTPQTKPEMIKHAISKHSGFGDDPIHSFNEDDLFKSGSPPRLNQMGTQNQGHVNRSVIKELPETSEAPFIQGSSQNILRNNPQNQINTSNRPSQIGLSLPQQFNPVSVPRNPSVLPRSAPTNSMQTSVGQSSYMHPNPRDTGPLSAQEFQHHLLGRTGQNEQWMRYAKGGYPSVPQHNYDQMQKWLIENQSRQQQAQSQFRPQQIEMQSVQQQFGTPPRQQQLGTQSIQQHLQTQSRQQSGAQSRQKQVEIGRQQYLLMQTRQQPYLTQSQSYTNIPGPENNNVYMPNRDQDQVHMFQYGQGHTNIQGHDDMSQHGLPSSYYGDRLGRVSRSEIQPEDFIRPEILSTSDRRSPYDHISMPNQAGRLQVTPPHQLSLAPHTQFNPYQTSTPRSEGHHNGARPKVPQVPRQLFPESQQYVYDRRNTDLRINDPRQVYEQSVGGTTSRMGQYTMYPAQPRTPLLNPAINPRPPTPQEGQRMELRLDINRAQLMPEMPVLSHAQTAPVFSPPKTPSKKSPDFHRTMSQAPLMPRKSPSLTGVASASPSQKDDKMSTSTSRSQFEEQDEAFKELGRTAEEALSQHSDHAPGMFLFSEDDFDEEINAEIDERYLENPAESLAHVLDPVQDTSFTLVFKSNVNGKVLRMNFFPKHASLTWEKILKEELDGVPMAEDFGLQRFCLRREDGNIIDLDSCLGNRSCTVIMTEATDSDTWWIEGGMISK